MGRLIVSAQMTMDAVMDQIEGWFDPQAESEQHGMEELRGADFDLELVDNRTLGGQIQELIYRPSLH